MLPLWNPYSLLGFPMHADPQSGFWYPIVWILGFFGDYNYPMLHIEVMLSLILGACGFYKLLKEHNIENNTSIFSSIMYICSGFFVGNFQHLTWLIAGAWIPYVILYFIRTWKNPNTLNALKLSVAAVLLITGSYPAFMIILFYVLIIYAIVYFVNHKSVHPKTILYLGLSSLITASICSGYLHSIFEAAPYITRGGPVTLELANHHPFSPQSMISFILPFATTADTDFFNADLSVRNAYFGVLALAFLLMSTVKILKNISLWIAALLFLLASFGDYTPIREWLYHFLPGMNLFRFPSIFRYFFILFFLFITSKHLTDLGINRKNLMLAVSFIILTILAVTIVYAEPISFTNISQFFTNPFTYHNTSTISKNIALQTPIQLFILLTAIILTTVVKNETILKKSLLVIATVEIIFALQFNFTATGVSDFKASTTHLAIDSLPKTFLPFENSTLESYKNDGIPGSPIWQNASFYLKKPTYKGRNGFKLLAYKHIRKDTSLLLKNFVHFKNDPQKITIDSVSANFFAVSWDHAINDSLAIFQCNYPNWLIKTNDAFNNINATGNYLTFPVTKAATKASLHYQPALVIGLFWWAVIGFGILLSSVAYLTYKTQNPVNQKDQQDFV